jgi:hypothetical protein
MGALRSHQWKIHLVSQKAINNGPRGSKDGQHINPVRQQSTWRPALPAFRA